MKKITHLDRKVIRQLNSEMELTLNKVFAQYGLAVKTGAVRFSGTNFSTKVEVSIVTSGGVAMTNEAKAWDMNAKYAGITHLSVGDKFTLGGEAYTVEGWNSRGKKYPVIVERGGKRYKMSAYMVQNGKKV